MIKYKLLCKEIGFPVLIKASGGGGGKGMKVVNNEKEFEEQFSMAKTEANYMKGENIEINIETFKGKKNFTAYTMDLTKKYIEINADYRS